MKITKDIINRDRITKGSYLALLSMDIYCETNTYIPPWDVFDHKFLKQNVDGTNGWKFQGWKRIDNIPLKFNKGKAPCRHFLEIDGKLKYRKENNYTSVNVLLVLYKKRGTWNNCHPYGTSNASYYNLHRDEFDGWIDLEDIPIVLEKI